MNLSDTENGNTNWKYYDILGLETIYNFDPFDYLGTIISACIPPDHTKIQVHLICDYKKYVRYKAFMVASVNMTGPNLNTYYYSFISLHYMRTVVFLAELNNIDTLTGEISNAYLTELTAENIFFDSGAYFALFGHSGHFLLIKTALYSLNISGDIFHSCVSDALTSLGFVPPMVGCGIWIRNEVN